MGGESPWIQWLSESLMDAEKQKLLFCNDGYFQRYISVASWYFSDNISYVLEYVQRDKWRYSWPIIHSNSQILCLMIVCSMKMYKVI